MVHTLKNTTNRNVLIDIISKTSSSDVIIQSINNVNNIDVSMYEISILVSNKEKLEKFMNDLSMIEDIVYVERVIK